MDRNLNDLLKWSIENTPTAQPDNADSSAPAPAAAAAAPSRPATTLNEAALRALMGGPSDADLMRDAMAAILSPEVDAAATLVAWENLEMMVQNLDNANNLENLALWPPLVGELHGEGAQARTMAAWTVGTAVQNNEKTQEKLLAYNVFPILVRMATEDADATARKKAIYAISSGVRNFQPGLDAFLKELPQQYQPASTIEASDMEAIDDIMNKLRADARR